MTATSMWDAGAVEHRGREFSGQTEQCRGAGWSGVEPELAEPFARLVGADRLVGCPVGEQQARVFSVAEGSVAHAELP